MSDVPEARQEIAIGAPIGSLGVAFRYQKADITGLDRCFYVDVRHQIKLALADPITCD
jgi:hypothetical protein